MPLFRWLRTEKREARWQALGPETPSAELIDALLNAPSAETRRRAAELLGERRDVAAVEPLIDRLKQDDDGRVKQVAAIALGAIGDIRALESLLEAVRLGHGFLQDDAARAASRFGTAGSDGLLAILREEHREAWSTPTRSVPWSSAAAALGGDERAVNALSAWLKHDRLEARHAAAVAIGKVRHPSAQGPLTSLLEDESSDIVWVALVGLENLVEARLLSESAIEPVARVLAGDNSANAGQAAWVLRRMGDSPKAQRALAAHAAQERATGAPLNMNGGPTRR